MAEIKHTWTIATSPRSPYKLPGTLELFKSFNNQVWDKAAQAKYAALLTDDDRYEGKSDMLDPGFSARDRINRAPQAFGFINIDKKTKIATITPAGQALLEGKRENELFTRQLLKWQFPSFQHNNRGYEDFYIKPFLETLRLSRDLNGVTKFEIAAYIVPFTDFRKFEEVKRSILAYRDEVQKLKSRIEKNKFRLDLHRSIIKEIYKVEIKSKRIKIRESKNSQSTIDKFVDTKRKNTMDYADATIRYFRATGLFTITERTHRLKIAETQHAVVEEILRHIDRKPLPIDKRNEFVNYLHNPHLPTLPTDDGQVLRREILQLEKTVKQLGASPDVLPSEDTEVLKDQIDDLRSVLTERRVKIQQNSLKQYEQYEDIIRTFNLISKRDQTIFDRPLMYEWNIWRLFSTLDDGEVIGNFTMDDEGRPLSNAPGGMGDIVCYYKDFVLLVEVTLSNRIKQYEMEGEPIFRHLGDVQLSLKNKGDSRPVYGIFAADNIGEEIVAHIFLSRNVNIERYGGKVRFIPLSTKSLSKMLEAASSMKINNSDQLRKFIQWADKEASASDSEKHWQEKIDKQVIKWNRL